MPLLYWNSSSSSAACPSPLQPRQRPKRLETRRALSRATLLDSGKTLFSRCSRVGQKRKLPSALCAGRGEGCRGPMDDSWTESDVSLEFGTGRTGISLGFEVWQSTALATVRYDKVLARSSIMDFFLKGKCLVLLFVLCVL